MQSLFYYLYFKKFPQKNWRKKFYQQFLDIREKLTSGIESAHWEPLRCKSGRILRRVGRRRIRAALPPLSAPLPTISPLNLRRGDIRTPPDGGVSVWSATLWGVTFVRSLRRSRSRFERLVRFPFVATVIRDATEKFPRRLRRPVPQLCEALAWGFPRLSEITVRGLDESKSSVHSMGLSFSEREWVRVSERERQWERGPTRIDAAARPGREIPAWVS